MNVLSKSTVKTVNIKEFNIILIELMTSKQPYIKPNQMASYYTQERRECSKKTKKKHSALFIYLCSTFGKNERHLIKP